MKLFSTDIRSTYVTTAEYKRMNGTLLGTINLLKAFVLEWWMRESLPVVACMFAWRAIRYIMFFIGVVACLRYIF